jgi:hypothetical protein
VDGPTRRYLPERAWGLLDEDEEREAERNKAESDQQGKQYVANPLAAEAAKRRAGVRPSKKALYEEAKRRGGRGRSKMSKAELERALGG